MSKTQYVSIENLDLSTEIPKLDDSSKIPIKEHIVILKNLLADQQAGIDLLKYHIKKIEEKLELLNA